MRLKDDALMQWPACSSDLNPIQTLRAINKRTVYANIRQCSSQDNLWKAVQDTVYSVEPSTIKKLIDSVTERQF